jgi:hypothetical protein
VVLARGPRTLVFGGPSMERRRHRPDAHGVEAGQQIGPDFGYEKADYQRQSRLRQERPVVVGVFNRRITQRHVMKPLTLQLQQAHHRWGCSFWPGRIGDGTVGGLLRLGLLNQAGIDAAQPPSTKPATDWALLGPPNPDGIGEHRLLARHWERFAPAAGPIGHQSSAQRMRVAISRPSRAVPISYWSRSPMTSSLESPPRSLK